jgi:hypothetical protein
LGRGFAGLSPIQHIDHHAIAKPIMAKPCARWGLQHDAAINRGEAFDILGQAQRAGQIIARRRIKAEDQAIAGFLRPIGHWFGPIHYHSAVSGMAADPQTDYRCLLREGRNAEGDPNQQQGTRKAHQSKLAKSRSISL